MNNKKVGTEKIYFLLSVFFMLLFGLSFLIMPKAVNRVLNTDDSSMLLVVASWFWVSLIVSHSLMLAVTLKRMKSKFTKEGLSKLPAILTFFSSKEAKVADIILIVMLVGFTISVSVTDGFTVFLFLSAAVLALEAHCVLNGKNYLYIKQLKAEGDVK